MMFRFCRSANCAQRGAQPAALSPCAQRCNGPAHFRHVCSQGQARPCTRLHYSVGAAQFQAPCLRGSVGVGAGVGAVSKVKPYSVQQAHPSRMCMRLLAWEEGATPASPLTARGEFAPSGSGLHVALRRSRCPCVRTAGGEDRLGLDVDGLALQGLAIHGHEAAHTQRLARLHVSLDPRLDAGKGALSPGRRLLGHDLAALVLHERVLRQAADRLLLRSPQDKSLREHAAGHLGDALRLHCLHRLACLGRGLRSLHRLRQRHGPSAWTDAGVRGGATTSAAGTESA
mmetsp:Transcript_52538/g.135615  ORF Transcript_52538/g.135615 Transcript_52538/m.135615 type:complete len:286 (-) Transcript_52538:21-878(-)